MFSKIKFVGGLAALVLAAPLPTQAASDVVLWHAYRGQERKALEQVVKTYNASQEKISLKLLAVPYDAFGDKITAAIPRNKGPDLFIFAQDRLGDWAASEVIEPIDFWLDDDLVSAFLPPTLEALTYDDAVYGLPIAFKMIALIYNKKLVPEAPKTTDEMIKIGKKLTDVKKKTFGLAYENANFWFHGMWFQGFGGRVFDGRGQPQLDSEASIKALQFAQDLSHNSGIMPEEVSATLVNTLFNRSQVGMVVSGPWFLAEVAPGIDYGVAPLPVISSNQQKPRPFLTAEGVIMSAKSKNKKAAFEVMKYLTSKETGLTMAVVGRQTPARAEVYDDPMIGKDPILMPFREQLPTSVPTPNTSAMRMVWTPVTTMMNKVINGKMDPKDVVSTAQTEVVKLTSGARR